MAPWFDDRPTAPRPARLSDGRQLGVRQLTALERLRYQQIPVTRRSAWLIVQSAVDTDGQAVFQQADIEWLTVAPAALVEPLAAAARRYNRLEEGDVDQLLADLLEQEEIRIGLRLALLFQAPDPRQFLRAMDSATFALWRAFLELEPVGGRADDARMGTLVALLANIHRDEKKRSQPFAASDWFPWLDDTALDERADDDSGSILAQLAKAYTLQAAATGTMRTELDLSRVPDIYLTPADRAKKAAAAGTAAGR